MLSALEVSLLVGQRAGELAGVDDKAPAGEDVRAVVAAVVDGRYADALASAPATAMFAAASTTSLAEVPTEASAAVGAWCAAGAAEEGRPMAALAVGAAALLAFVQANWTGPAFADADAPAAVVPALAAAAPAALAALLSVDGEDVYEKAAHAHLLVAARAVLLDCPAVDACPTACVWAARMAFTHQRILGGNVQTLADVCHARLATAHALFAVEDSQWSLKKEVAAQLCLEEGMVHAFYASAERLRGAVDRAKALTGLKCELTGRMGVRTKHQVAKKAQLVLDASNDVAADTLITPQRVPEGIDIKDDLLHESAQLDDAPEEPPLAPLDQAIVMAESLALKLSHPFGDQLTDEQARAYVERVLVQPVNWLVHASALLFRSRLESARTRTVERTLEQLKVLLDQYNVAAPPAGDRTALHFAVDYPPRWKLQKELASLYMKMGVVPAALELFEQLDMWEEAVSCHIVLDQNDKALAVLEERLAVAPTPALWCLMGDVTGGKIEHYEKAWNLSVELGRKSARAQRSWATALRQQGKIPEAIEHYEAALALNPMPHNVWFAYGCCCMQANDLEKGAQAFRRVVALEPEEGEAWANLGAIYMHQKQMPKAHSALKEALRNNRENWKMWENFLYVCMAMGEVQSAIEAVARIAELSKRVDAEVLHLLVLAFQGEMKRESPLAARLRTMLGDLFQKLVAVSATNPFVWRSHGLYAKVAGREEEALDCYRKSCTCLHAAPYDAEEDKFKAMARAVLEYAQEAGAAKDAGHMRSSAQLLQEVVDKTKARFEQTDEWRTLSEVAKQISG